MSELLRRLAPFRGMEGRFVDDVLASSEGGTPMRGGYNVEVVDGEWWVRMGHKTLRRSPTGTQPFYFILHGVSLSRMVIVGPWAALSVDTSGANEGKVRALYSPDATSNTDFTNGLDTATSAAAVASVGDMMLVGSDPTDEVYRVTAVDGGGTGITLDRPYTGATATVSTRYFRFLMEPLEDITVDSPFPGECSAVVMEQLVSHSSGTLWTTNPAVTAGRRYLIFSGPESGPIAIDLDNTTAPLKSWFRLTGESSPTELTKAHYCTLWKNRLWLAVADDPTGTSDDLTLYYSGFGDFLVWHTGVRGASYQHNFLVLDGNAEEDPLRAIEPLGEELFAYRKNSFALIQADGSGFRPVLVPTGFGPSGGSVVRANQRHYMLTGWGPSVNNGRTIEPLLEKARQSMGEWSFWDDVPPVAFLHDWKRKRIYWNFQIGTPKRHQVASIPASGTQSYTGYSYEKVGVWLVYDYAVNEAWFEDGCNWVAGGMRFNGDAYMVRPDGSVFIVDGLGSNATGKDEPVVSTDADFVVDALGETPWMQLRPDGKWWILNYALVKLRALDSVTASVFDVTDLWTLTSETLHLATVDFFTDWDMSAAKYSKQLSVTVSTMQALVAEGNRMPPIMTFDISPEDVAGKVLKLRIRNAGGAGGTSKGHFRVSDIELWGEAPKEADWMPRGSLNRST